MPRVITSETILLLLLIKVYCSDAASEKGTIPLLSFITSHITSNVSSQVDFAIAATHANSRTAMDLRALFLLLSNTTYSRPDENPGLNGFKTVLEKNFSDQLNDINSLDALVQFIRSLSQVTYLEEQGTSIRISLTSLFGTFIRRQGLEFEKLQFSDQMKLWHEFDHYRKQDEFELYSQDLKYDESIDTFDERSQRKIMEVINHAMGEVTVESESPSVDFLSLIHI